MKKTILCLSLVATLLVAGCDMLNPEGIKPVPVAAGQDAIVVNAERIQATSLFAYHQMITMELTHRAVLPVEVSRAVDRAREEFLPNWRASRDALKEYKEKRGGNLDTLHRLSAALSVAQASFLKLAAGSNPNDITAMFTALTQLNEAVATLRK